MVLHWLDLLFTGRTFPLGAAVRQTIGGDNNWLAGAMVVIGHLFSTVGGNWAAVDDPASGHTYYYNQSTGATQWEPPAGGCTQDTKCLQLEVLLLIGNCVLMSWQH